MPPCGMADAPFDACWDRWERSDAIRRTLPNIWNEYIHTDPFEFSLNSHGDGYYVLTAWQHDPLSADFALAFGEWLFHLRSTLDYIVWATATHVSGKRPPPNEGQLQFPIYEERAAWDRNLYRIRGLLPHQQEMLELMQPYRNPDSSFREWINRLARIDRHRRPMDGTAYVAVIEPVFTAGGSDISLEWGERVLVDGWADLARIKVTPWDEDTDVQVNPRVGIDPEIREWSESPFWSRLKFDDRLKLIQTMVQTDIVAFEYDCTGRSREQQMLTQEFRDLSDARRERVPVVPPSRRAVDWVPAGSGSRATEAQLRGEDFPRDTRDRDQGE